MGRAHVAVVALVASYAVGACSLLIPVGDLDDGIGAPDGASGSGDDVATSLEGGGGDGSPESAGGDGEGGGGEGGNGVDGGTGDTSTPPFCRSVDASFCEDFDDSNAQTFPRWTVDTDDGGTVARVTSGHSRPNALEIRYRAIGAAEQPTATLETSLGVVSRTRIRYQFIVDVSGGLGSTMFLNETESRTSNAMTGVRMSLREGNATFGATVYPPGGASPSFPTVSSMFTVVPGVWRAVDMTLDVSTTPAKFSATIDGVAVATDAPIAGATFGAGVLAVYAGSYYVTGATNGWVVRVDDVAVTTE